MNSRCYSISLARVGNGENDLIANWKNRSFVIYSAEFSSIAHLSVRNLRQFPSPKIVDQMMKSYQGDELVLSNRVTELQLDRESLFPRTMVYASKPQEIHRIARQLGNVENEAKIQFPIIFFSDNGAASEDISKLVNALAPEAKEWFEKTFDNRFENWGRPGSKILPRTDVRRCRWIQERISAGETQVFLQTRNSKNSN